MKKLTKKGKFAINIISIILLAILLLGWGWITYIPSFNLKHIKLTINHREEINDIIDSLLLNQVFDSTIISSMNSEVIIIYEYTSSCFLTLVRFDTTFLNTRERSGRFILQAVLQDDQWLFNKGLDITRTDLNSILPQIPPNYGCNE